MKQPFLEFSASHHALTRYPALLNPNLQPIRIQGGSARQVGLVHPGAQAESHRVLDPYFDLILRDGITVFRSTVRCGIEELSVCRKDAGKVSTQTKVMAYSRCSFEVRRKQKVAAGPPLDVHPVPR